MALATCFGLPQDGIPAQLVTPTPRQAMNHPEARRRHSCSATEPGSR